MWTGENGTRAVVHIAQDIKNIAYNVGQNPPALSKAARFNSATYQSMLEAGLKPHQPFVGPVGQFVERVIANVNRPTAIWITSDWSAVRYSRSCGAGHPRSG